MKKLKTSHPVSFDGTIFPQDSQILLKLLGLDVNQTFQTNESCEILTKDGSTTDAKIDFDNTCKLVTQEAS